jgi:hypothetical protein
LGEAEARGRLPEKPREVEAGEAGEEEEAYLPLVGPPRVLDYGPSPLAWSSSGMFCFFSLLGPPPRSFFPCCPSLSSLVLVRPSSYLLRLSDLGSAETQKEKLVLKFLEPVFITRVNILESLNPGPVYKVVAKRNKNPGEPKQEEREDEREENEIGAGSGEGEEEEWVTIWEGQPESGREKKLNVLEVEPDTPLSFPSQVIAI